MVDDGHHYNLFILFFYSPSFVIVYRMKRFLTGIVMFASLVSVWAQRECTDQLNRGLVAVKTSGGVFCSWRIQADEYYGVTYNLYRDGAKVNDAPLSTSNFLDASGKTSSSYSVRAVVNGVEQEASSAADVWSSFYKEIIPQHDASLTSTYIPNDACCADVDGDGELEILLKYDNKEEGEQLYPKAGPTVNGVANGEYTLFECLKMDGTVLWWVNCGPNMGDFQNNEQNIVGYDWDGDGKAEVVMRLEEGSCVHMADGTTYTIGADGQNGTAWTNYRNPKGSGSVEWFTYYGKEFLFYCEGATGKPYQCIDFPCARLEVGETDLNAAWGDGYGHRSNKFFFGAPYLDGQHPSIFIGRGIYTRHKFVALDVNPTTHALTQRWRWMNNSNGPWKGQGYHNYSIADVDWDGRDEIIWGSMVIDDNGKGLSTTGLGHGDAHHVGDLNPYAHGQEGFFCNEDQPANNFRDLTTSKIYYRMTDTNDAGRCLAGNFSNAHPGSIGFGSHDSPISTVTNNHVSSMVTTGLCQNFRIYWDGDLQEECMDGAVTKYGQSGSIASFTGGYTNNGTKNTPCYQGDLLGDWREEVIMRTSNNRIRIYTTTAVTPWRNYSLWYDHQYRNAMVWQMCGYNQPPHVSYFLGELEGITMAPPPLTMHGREKVENGGEITSAHAGKHLVVNEYADASVNVASGAQPSIVTFNVPSWVQGAAPSECTTLKTKITYQYFNLNVTGAAFSGSTRVVKQGDGTLVLPAVDQTYSGSTDVWAGTLQFDGKMTNSRVWLNRFAELHSAGEFKTVQADYAAKICPGGVAQTATLKADSLILNFGARAVFDIASLTEYDKIEAGVVTLEHKNWANGPEYNAPVFEFVGTDIEPGTYQLIKYNTLIGDLAKVSIEGLEGKKAQLTQQDGAICLEISGMRDAETAVWTGAGNGEWNLGTGENFSTSDHTFVTGDAVVFTDDAQLTGVKITEEVAPSSVTFLNNTKTYTLAGSGSIAGAAPLKVEGAGLVKINNVNTYTGGTYVSSGKLLPSSLANKDGAANGALGGVSNTIYLSQMGTLQIAQGMTASHPIKLGEGSGVIEVKSGTFIVNGSIGKQGTKANLYKEGNGVLQLNCTATYDTLFLNAGEVYDFQDAHFNGKTVVLNGGTLRYSNSYGGNSSDNVKLIVPEGKTASIYPDGRCDYTGALLGAGSLNVYATFVRLYFKGDWSKFEGTINAYQYKSGSYDPSFDFLNTYGVGKATLNITSGTTVHTNGKNFAIGALTGTGSIDNTGSNATATNMLTIGGKNTDFTFGGTIVGSNVTKTGTGTWNITKPEVLASAGTLYINAGRVKINQATPSASLTGSKITYVRNDGELVGRGWAQAVNVESGAAIRPGINTNQTSNTGVLRILGNLNVKEGAHAYINKMQAADYNNKGVIQFSCLECDGTLTLNGTLHVTYNSNYEPAAGDSIIVLKANVLAGSPSFDLQELPEGLIWDTSTLMSDGVIRVASSTGIQHVSRVMAGELRVFNLAGTLVATISAIDVAEPDDLLSELRAIGLPSAVYLVHTATGTQKVVLK